ncbi:MAG: CotH kinase family protein, partial [candidate division KSB1 bacterium]|nr:CotH kinase family protein [candidate division KSB1 bacterium]
MKHIAVYMFALAITIAILEATILATPRQNEAMSSEVATATMGNLIWQHTTSLQFQSSNLPIVIIDTFGQEIPDEPKIIARMGIIDNGEGQRNYLTDPCNNYDGPIGIEIRGSTTRWFPKLQYAIETRDRTGNDSTVSLLGFPPEEDWILYAPYTDKSLMRNVLAYRLSNDLGRYASRTRYCELVLNGSYEGVYVLMEKIKRDRNRVNISKLQPTDIEGDAVTGGYIIKIDKPDGAKNQGWDSPFLPYPGAWQRIFYQYHYPDQDEIVPAQQAYIKTFMTVFETVMSGPWYADSQVGYSRYIDIDSFVDNFILIELSKNIDGYRLSTFFHKDRDSKNGKLVMGPIWDYNLAFGNADYYLGAMVSGWQVEFLEKDDNWENPFWWRKLMADSNFVNKINRRWKLLRKDVLSIPRIYGVIDSLATLLDEAQRRNFERWPILGTYVWPNPYIGGSYMAEVRYLKSWVQNRILWMDASMPGNAATDIGNLADLQQQGFHLTS